MSAPLLLAAMIAGRRASRPKSRTRGMARWACAILAGAAVLAASAPAAVPAPEVPRASVQWAGGPTLLLRFGPIAILTDPVLGEGPQAFRIFDPNSGTPDMAQARLAPLPDLPYERADLVLVSHAHEDHLDAAAIVRLGGAVPFLVPAEQVEAVRARGAVRVTGISWGETHRLEDGGYEVAITAVPARHSEAPQYLPVLGAVNSYWIELRRGDYRRTIYWTGDSFAPADGVPAALRAPDLFVPHLGAVGVGGPIGPVSMGAAQAIPFARAVRPRVVLPIHHSTFSLYREPADRFVEAARAEGLRVERLAEGGHMELP
jgi:N-acyl-phosphatidylethanolamine-hydrolysing phospholipase D